jgi:hypothetical protein
MLGYRVDVDETKSQEGMELERKRTRGRKEGFFFFFFFLAPYLGVDLVIADAFVVTQVAGSCPSLLLRLSPTCCHFRV